MCVVRCDSGVIYLRKKMALARFSGLSSQLLCRNKVYLYTARWYADDIYKGRLPWNYIWAPEPYSKENHDKIAEKYHMHPKDYKPYPNDEHFVGDYPALPMISPAAKDPYYPYDDPYHKRNYHEPIHDLYTLMSPERYDYGVKQKVSIEKGSAIFVVIITTYILICILLEPYPKFHPWMEKQYPQKGKVHYTFESME